jgi:hypothetical protein
VGNGTGRDFGKVFSVVFLGMAEILESVHQVSRQVC